MEREAKTAKPTEGEERATVPAAARSGGAPTAADLFPAEDTESAPQEAKPTLESLFGPDVATKNEEAPNAAEVFGEKVAPGEAKNETTQPAEEQEG